ncbi:MAG: SRPBCC family protein [Bacteroidia bacterium]|nr:SRPBCC family protein [Bacteroidia bacterium]
MRCAVFIFILGCFFSCRNEDGWYETEIGSEVDVALPATAVFANLSAFEGLSAAVPDLFWIEKVIEETPTPVRIIVLSDSTYFEERLVEVDEDQLQIFYTVDKTSLPIKDVRHLIKIAQQDDGQKCIISWVTTFVVQEKNRERIQTKFSGMQEAYLYSLQLMGVELEEMMNDESF